MPLLPPILPLIPEKPAGLSSANRDEQLRSAVKYIEDQGKYIEVLSRNLKSFTQDLLNLINNRPSFLVKPTSDQLNIAIDGWVNILFETTVFDIGDSFSSYYFTAPIKEIYLLSATLYAMNLDSAATYYWIRINGSNRDIFGTMLDIDLLASGDLAFHNFVCVGLLDMDQGDVAYVQMYQSGGTAQTDIEADYSSFSGCLLLAQ